MDSFDFVILGGGPAGERAALQAAKLSHTSAIVERHRVVGGTSINWGATAEPIMDTPYNYPTLSDLYRHAALEAHFGARA